MRVRWPITGAAIVGIFSVLSYANSRPDPDIGTVIGLIMVNVLVIACVLLIAGYSRYVKARS